LVWHESGSSVGSYRRFSLDSLWGRFITGENIGFQLIATPTNRGDVATGKLMIKVNGRWLPAAASTGLMPAR
jgi:hypothetical protein